MQQLSKINYKDRFVTSFKGDQSGNKNPRQTPGVLYSKALPTPVQKPELLAWSDELGESLGIARPSSEQDLNILAGNHTAPSMRPYAACYAGHQFGNWAGQLGDGRAITLGEIEPQPGEAWELQLKGAGPTPYSRRADGRAVLRSSVREYLMSEAMHYLGVPTTRALSLVATGEQVMRDMFYDGHPAYEPGAIVMRVAPTFLRFGNFEMLAARGDKAQLTQLTDWTIENFYPHITGDNKVIAWFREVLDRTASMVVDWMRVGFVHGVMNTDNMSILGVTIDYGPYSFVDDYDPMFTPNTTDLPGRRYAFGRQGAVAKWNLGCLAGALAPMLSDTKELVAVLNEYDDLYWTKYYGMMAKKLGLNNPEAEDKELVSRFEKSLTDIKPDMTIFFQLLATVPQDIESPEGVRAHFKPSFYGEPLPKQLTDLYDLILAYQSRLQTLGITQESARQTMSGVNPRFILRNYLLHQAIEELGEGKNELFRKLEEAMKTPYEKGDETLFHKRPDWASQKAGCSMLSCSS